MQAIKTNYIGPTNHRGARIKVECAAKTITVSWDHALDVEANHIQAAARLVKALDWKVTLASGVLKSGDYAHVLIPTLPSKGRK